MRKAFFTAAVSLASLAAPGVHNASAGTISVTNVGTAYGDNSGIVDVNLPGAPANPWTTPIFLYTAPGGGGTPIVVFCDDLFHDIYLGSTDTFNKGAVTTDSDGHTLTQPQSGEMGYIAQIGIVDYHNNNMDGAIAAQAAIWAVEYGKGNISINADYVGAGIGPGDGQTILNDFNSYIGLKYNGASYADGLIGIASVQSQITGVPESSTWALMLLGFAGLGVLGYRRANTARTPFAAA